MTQKIEREKDRMPPKKGKKGKAKKKQATDDKPEKDPRDNPREYELHDE